MPTFESIGVHPELRSRLVTLSKFQAADNENRDVTHCRIETPLSLLSRNPTTVGLLDKHTQKAKLLSLPQVHQLRQDVALAIIAQSRPGKRAKLFEQDIPQSHAARDDNEDGNIMDGPMTFPATISALDLDRQYMLSSQNRTLASLSTNCPALDQLIASPLEHRPQSLNQHDFSELSSTGSENAGIPFGYVTQFCGPSACGKTQLCLQLAASTSPQTTTYYMSSSGALSCLADRLSVLARHGSSEATPAKYSQPYWSALQTTRFVHVPASDPYIILEILQQIESNFLEKQVLLSQATEVSSPRDSIRQDCATDTAYAPVVLILDSVSGCLSGIGKEALGTIGLALKRMARQYLMAVVVTNGTTRDRLHSAHVSSTADATARLRQRDWKPAMGRAWSKVADIRILLEQKQQAPSDSTLLEGTLITATLEHHHSKNDLGSACFGVDSLKGIVSV